MLLDISPPPLILPPKPAIIRSVTDLPRHDRRAIEKALGVKLPTFPSFGEVTLGLTLAHGLRRRPPVPTVAYAASGSFNAGSTAQTKTATSVSCGTAATGRCVVVVYMTTGGYTINSNTIDGATRSYVADFNSTSQTGQAYFYFQKDAGTTIDISVTMSASGDRAGYAVYAIYNLFSYTPTLYSSTTVGTSGATRTVNPTVPADGIMIGAGVGNGTTVTFTGLTKGADVPYENWDGAVGYYDDSGSGSTASVTSSNSRSASAAVWR